MKLKLVIDGKDKTFSTGNRLPALIFKRALNVATKLQKSTDDPTKLMEALDHAVDFIAEDLFHGKFTADEFWEGIQSDNLMDVVQQCLSHPIERISSAMSESKN